MKGDMILLATGGTPKTLNIEGLPHEKVFTLRSKKDAKRIKETAASCKSCFILGASFIGLEAASSLTNLGLNVTVAAPESIPLELVLGKTMGQKIEKLHKSRGVEFHMETTAKRISDSGKEIKVMLSDGTEVSTDMIIIGIGIIPVTDYLKNSTLLDKGVVLVDENLQTSVEGIYAAGDIALYPNALFGEDQRVEHWVAAETQGQKAARSMLGKRGPYKELPFFWTMQHNKPLKYIGYVKDPDTIVSRGDPEKGPFYTGYYKDGTLKAVAGYLDGNEMHAFSEILKSYKDLSPEEFSSKNL